MSGSEILRRIDALRREIEYIRRDMLQIEEKDKVKSTLFGCVPAEDVTEDMIEEAKKSLFRELEDI